MSAEAQIAKRRVQNATGAELRSGDPDTQVGTQGAIAYALLDVASAIRSLKPDEKLTHLMYIADTLAEAVAEGDSELAERIARNYHVEREGVEIDQSVPFIPEPGS